MARDQRASEVAQRVGALAYNCRRVFAAERLIDQDYEITPHELGQGSCGAVKMGALRRPVQGGRGGRRKVAVKSFSLFELQPKQRLDLASEISTFLSVDHPHVVRLFDVYETNAELHLVMECLHGGELYSRLAEAGRFTEKRSVSMLRQILLAINHLHSNGIVHRDVKLENFLFDKPGSEYLKLIDFGMSTFASGRLSTTCGTAEYVAPEVLRGSYTQACDMWSVGVMAYIMISGRMPWSARDPDFRSKIMAGAYDIDCPELLRASPKARHFLQCLLQVDPSRRMTAKDALRHAWLADYPAPHVETDPTVLAALWAYSSAPRFQRCCLSAVALVLSNEEQLQLRDQFVALDKEQRGAISLEQLQQAMLDKFRIKDAEVHRLLAGLAALPLKQNAVDGRMELRYTDFLAAMLASRASAGEDSLQAAFRKFDLQRSGRLSADGIQRVVGREFEGRSAEELLDESFFLDESGCAKAVVTYADFTSYLKAAHAGGQHRWASVWNLFDPDRFDGEPMSAFMTTRSKPCKVEAPPAGDTRSCNTDGCCVQ